MVRGLPAYEWWKNPPDEVLLRVYLFNVTNSERFENGIDSKLELNEIGPIVFRWVTISIRKSLNCTSIGNKNSTYFLKPGKKEILNVHKTNR